MNLPRLALAALLLAAPFSARADYLDFMQDYIRGQSGIPVALYGPSGLEVHYRTLLELTRGPDGSLTVWSGDWRTRVTIPNSEAPIVRARDTDGALWLGDHAYCASDSSVAGFIQSIYMNPARTVYKVRLADGSSTFVPFCKSSR